MLTMKKRSLQVALLLLTVLLFLGLFPSIAQAHASIYISAFAASIRADGNGKVSVLYDITGTGIMEEIGSTTITVYENGNVIKTYQYTTTPSMMAYNTSCHGGSVTYSGTAGKSYYATVAFWAGKQGGGDARTKTTLTVTAK
jgi:hypothetical protein